MMMMMIVYDNDLGQQKTLQTAKYNPLLQMTIKLRPSAGQSGWLARVFDFFSQLTINKILSADVSGWWTRAFSFQRHWSCDPFSDDSQADK